MTSDPNSARAEKPPSSGKTPSKKKGATKKAAAKKSATKKAATKKAAAKKAAPKKAASKKAATKKSALKKGATTEVKTSVPEAKPQAEKNSEKKAEPPREKDQARAPDREKGRDQRDSRDSDQRGNRNRDQRDTRDSEQRDNRNRDQRDNRDRNQRDNRDGGGRDQRGGGGGGQRDNRGGGGGQRDGGGRGRRRNPVRGRVRGKGRRRSGGGGGGDGGGNSGGRDFDDIDQMERKAAKLTGPPVEVNGMLELAPKGFGFLRRPEKDFEQSREDVFLPPELVRKHGLRFGVWVHGIAKDGPRGPQLVEVTSVNEMAPDRAMVLPFFDELKATNPVKRIPFETDPNRYTTRVVDMMAPIGRGQRGLIVSPPRSGKTTMLLHLAEAVRERHSENLHLIVLLVDERPEEVTDFKRQLPDAEIYASSNDMPAKNHCRLAELCIERAKRLVEAGLDVFILLDSITRLARAYNNNLQGGGKGRGYQSGGIVAGALEMPRRLFAAARNTKEAGSLTIIGTALIQTNAKADEAIFQEFKGTGNMELVLDRKIAENFVYPAVDIFKSGTRREELLLPEHTLHKIYMIRRGLSGHRPLEAMERLLFFLKKFPTNAQMLLEIKG